MENKTFQENCRQIVAQYSNAVLHRFDGALISPYGAICIFCSKTLQNHKAVLQTVADDGALYEATYNGDKDELYLDVYEKVGDRYERTINEKYFAEMEPLKFHELCRSKTAECSNLHHESDGLTVTADDVYIVWHASITDNYRALTATPLSDGLYFEVAFNGCTNSLTVDTYKKRENICIENASEGVTLGFS